MREIKSALRPLGATFGVFSWCIVTAWLGTRSFWKVSVLCIRWRQIKAEVRLCPRGHEVPVFGLWDCACHSRFEGWAFARCEVCHETAGYVSCGVCGLPVRNPFLP